MSTLTISLPDDKYVRLRQLAKQRVISANKLVEERATTSIAEFVAESRFRRIIAEIDKMMRRITRKSLAFSDFNGINFP